MDVFRFHIEDIPWYVLLSGAYAIIVAFGIIFEQFPRLLMHPGAHHYIPGQPKCAIFKTCTLSQEGAAINVTIGIEASHEISISQSWHSIRILIRNSLASEVLRSYDATSAFRIDRTHLRIGYEPSVTGVTNITIFCSDTPLENYTNVVIPAGVSKFSSFHDNSITNACVSNETISVFSRSLISPAPIPGFSISVFHSLHDEGSVSLTLLRESDNLDDQSLATSLLRVISGESLALIPPSLRSIYPRFTVPNSTCAREIIVKETPRSLTLEDVNRLRKEVAFDPTFDVLFISEVAQLPVSAILEQMIHARCVLVPCNASATLIALIPSNSSIVFALPPNETQCLAREFAPDSGVLNLDSVTFPTVRDECARKAGCR